MTQPLLLSEEQEKEAFDRVVKRLQPYRYSQRKKIAFLAKVHPNTVHYWMSGRTNRAEVYNLMKIEKVLDEIEYGNSDAGL